MRYIDTGAATGKAFALMGPKYGAHEISRPPLFESITPGFALIVVDYYGKFEKAGFIYSRLDWEKEIQSDRDRRPGETPKPTPYLSRRYFIMSRATALLESGTNALLLKAGMMQWALEEVEQPISVKDSAPRPRKSR